MKPFNPRMLKRSGLTLLLVSLTMPLWAAQKAALVIGNSQYRGVGDSLKNPVTDAEDMAARLQALGYDTLLVKNASRDAFWDALEKFQGKLAPGGMAVIYYAGHGMQVDGRNYLVPVDALMKSRLRVDIESIAVQKVVELLQESGTAANLLILDACRNDPFPKEFRAMDQRGLSRMRDDIPTERTMILYAAKPGQVAQDGSGRNGVFTGELLKLMDIPGLALPQMYVRLKAAVQAASEGRTQQIYQEGDILADFVFRHGSTVNMASATVPTVSTVTSAMESDASLMASGQWRDPRTNMIWMRCSLGQVWDETTCMGQAKTYTWDEAMKAAIALNASGGYGGYRDWVLPHIEDLSSLRLCSTGFEATREIPAKSGGTKTVDRSCAGNNFQRPTIDQQIFPRTWSSFYWSSSDADNSSFAWGVDFGNGHYQTPVKGVALYVQLVRARQ